ncbi:MAG TPA: hypothetical protein VMH87_10020 [Pseudomonadales bacterium]|nr:hypothetical protein [Pseudomonadales bacterium]
MSPKKLNLTGLKLAGLVLFSCLFFMHAADWQWLRTAGGNNAEVAGQIAVDDAGSAYIVGSFNSTNCPFGSIVLTNTFKASVSTWDGFLAKYDTYGNIQWAVKFGGTNDDRAWGVAVDAQRNSYISGWFESTNFYIGNAILTNYSPYANPCLFVAKYDPDGHFLWARSAAGYSSSGQAVVADSAGNVYAAGSFTGTNIFGGSKLVGQGNGNIVLLKFDSNGNQLWVKQAGGSTGPDTPARTALALDSGNNVYLLANIRSTNAVFGSFTFSVAGTNFSQNMVVAKYDPSGNVLWGKEYGGTDLDGGTAIAIGPGTNIFVTGNFLSTNLAFGSTILHGTGNIIDPSIFVAVLDNNGNALSAWPVTCDNSCSSIDIAADPVGNCYIAGFFQGTNLTFNSGWLNTVILTNSFPGYFSQPNAFVAKFDASGNIIHVFHPVGPGNQEAFSVAVDSHATPYVTGWTMGTNVMFGSLATTNFYVDLFAAKLDANLPSLQIINGGITSDNTNAATVSWPILQTGSANFTLDSSSDLLTWTPTAPLNTVTGAVQYSEIVPKPDTQAFYRLRIYH